MNYTVTFLLGMLFPGRTKLQAWHASAEHSRPQTWKLSSCAIMPNLAPAGDAPADRNSAHWKWLDADEGKLRTGHTRSHLVTRGSQQWGYWHRPWENLLSIWPMKWVTQQLPIQMHSILQLLTPAHVKKSYFHVAHKHWPTRSKWPDEAHRLGKKGAEKPGQQADSLAIHFITPTVSTPDDIIPSQRSPDGEELLISQTEAVIWKLMWVGSPPFLMITGLREMKTTE